LDAGVEPDGAMPDLSVDDGLAVDLGDDLLGADLTPPPADLAFGDASGGVLNGSVVQSPGTTINLTLEGITDWAHWGLNNPGSFDHKLTGGSAISNFANIMGGGLTQFSSYPVMFTWTDGTPDTTAMPATGTSTGVYLYGTGQGFRITVPAGPVNRTLKLYVGGQQSTCTVTAHLSDGSAPDFIASVSDKNKLFAATVTIAYRGVQAGEDLVVDWVVTSSSGFAHIQSASLQ